MENATKALLIAAAILIAILIITLGVNIFSTANETVQGMDLSEQEVLAFNQQFDNYNGTNKRGTEVNSLLSAVLNNNVKKVADGENDLVVIVTLDESQIMATSTNSITTNADRSALYTVKVNHDGKGGLVKTIEITTND